MYGNQQNSGTEQVAIPPSSQDTTQRSKSCLFLSSMLIGALVGGIALGAVLAMYIKEQSKKSYIS